VQAQDSFLATLRIDSTWSKGLVKYLWKLPLNLWKQCFEAQHGKDSLFSQQRQLELLLARLERCYSLQSQMLSRHQFFVDAQFETRKTQAPHILEAWLANVESIAATTLKPPTNA